MCEPESLSDDEIRGIWESMPGGHEGWLKYFGYQQFARAVERRVVAPPMQSPVAVVERMPGATGFGIAVFKLSEVPLGTKLYAKSEPQP